MPHPITNGSAGEIHLLLGNEAIVRGAIEAGVEVVTCYPGTPSSEAPDTFYRLSPDGQYSFEYSVNEKVALEVGGGATLAGAMTLVTMKHVGVNVAADPLFTLTYIGSPGGLVLLSADDPGCHSSQNEQDNRLYARMAGLPVFEPSTAQEAKDMARDALLLSRELEQPVLLRTTTRLNHLRGPVELGEARQPRKVPTPAKNFRRFVPVPAVARARHPVLLENLEKARSLAESSPWNPVSGDGGVGIVASGISRAYVHDVLEAEGRREKTRYLELGFSYPLPEKACLDMLENCSTVLVVEEGEPVVENELRTLAQRHGLSTTILGKGTGGLTRLGEYDSGLVRRAVDLALGETPAEVDNCQAPEGLPLRPPNLCAGCPHRAAYYAVRQVFGDEARYSSDIGCYTLGLLPPLSAADFLLCMGSSVSAGSGFSLASDEPVVAFIGDSTFFHSGITGLVNAVFNHHDVLLVVLDNHTTAMTGHQPHPGVETTIHGANEGRVDIETIVRGCGVTQVATVNPLNLKKTVAALEEMKSMRGVRVLIAREPCPLHARKLLGKKGKRTAFVPETTDSVRDCVSRLACPAFRVDGEEVSVDENACSGCMVCLQITTDIKTKGTA